ncbi:MAG: hypothetical protein WAW26_03830 [Anaerolineae bacterium]
MTNPMPQPVFFPFANDRDDRARDLRNLAEEGLKDRPEDDPRPHPSPRRLQRSRALRWNRMRRCAPGDRGYVSLLQ